MAFFLFAFNAPPACRLRFGIALLCRRRNRFRQLSPVLRPARQERPGPGERRSVPPGPDDPAAAGAGPSGPDRRSISHRPGRHRRLPTAGIEEAEKIALLDEAIAALHSILVHRPGLVRVRLELALAFFLKEEDGLARQHFERVLAGRPTRAVAANVNRFLRVIRDRRRWSGYFGFSIAPDSNVNSASDAKYIYIYGLPFRRNEASRATSGTGVVAWGGGEYRYPLAGPLRLRSAADFAHREYSGKDFDQTFVAGRAGPHWTMSRNTELSLLASADQRWLAGARSSHDFGVLVEAKHRFMPRLRANGQASWHQRYHHVSKLRDGPLTAFSLGVTYIFLPTVQLRTLAGYSRQKTKSLPSRNAVFWTQLGTTVALPAGFTLGGSIEMRWTDFKGRWWPFTPDGAARKDRTRVLRASVLNRGLTVYGFSPQLIFVNEQRKSNAQLYDLKRNRVEMRIIRQF